MNTPYTYLITFFNPDTWKVQYYYGVRYAKACHPNDLFVTYFTSSQRVKSLIKQYGQSCFHVEVRKIFPDTHEGRLQAVKWEKRVLRRLKVHKRTDFLNQSIQGEQFCMYGDLNPSKRPEVRDKMAKGMMGKNKGKTRTPEQRRLQSLRQTGIKRPPEFCSKMSELAFKRTYTSTDYFKRRCSEGRKQYLQVNPHPGLGVRWTEKQKDSKRGPNNPNFRKPETADRLNNPATRPMATCDTCGNTVRKTDYVRYHSNGKCKSSKLNLSS